MFQYDLGANMKVEINENFMTSVVVKEEWGMYDNIAPDDLTPEQLFKIIKGEDRCSMLSNEDHPEFKKLREQLKSTGYIEIQRSWWNGDRVLKSFTLNNKKFKKGEKFPCAAAMLGYLTYMK